MVKFEFSIKTRDGQKVGHLMIMGVDQPDAERKLRQMYRDCEILRCEVRQGNAPQQLALSLEMQSSLLAKAT